MSTLLPITFILIQVKFIKFFSISKATFPNELVKEKHCLFYPNPDDWPFITRCLFREEGKKGFNFNTLDAMPTSRRLGMLLIHLASFWLVSK